MREMTESKMRKVEGGSWVLRIDCYGNKRPSQGKRGCDYSVIDFTWLCEYRMGKHLSKTGHKYVKYTYLN